MALQVSPSIMTESLMRDFDVGAAVLGIMAAVYFYSYTAMQIPSGFSLDSFGPRRLLALASFICALGAFFFGFSHHILTAALGRFFMGFGSAFAFIGVLTVAARWFPSRYFAFLTGIAQFLAALGALFGELPLAALVNAYGWREVIIALSFIGVFLSACCFWIIRDHKDPKYKAVSHHHLLRESRAIFKNTQTLWIAMYSFCSWGPVVVFASLWGVPYLMVRYQMSNVWAAFACAMIWIGVGLASPLIGYVSDAIRRRKLPIFLTAIIGFFASLIMLYIPNLPLAFVFILLFLIGIASSGQILCFALVKDITIPWVTSTAIGLNNMAVVAGGAILQPLVGFFLHIFWDGNIANGIPVYSVENYQLGLTIVPLCFFIATCISIFCIRETYCQGVYRNDR